MAVVVIDHPVVQDCLLRARDKDTKMIEFRALMHRMTLLIAYRATQELTTEDRALKTPLGAARGKVLADCEVVVVPILRAGLGMVGAMLELFPQAIICPIGLKRDEETFAPHCYYCCLPKDLSGKTVIILDPMLATGGTLAAAADLVKERGGKGIRVLTIVAAPEGIAKVEEKHPGLVVYTAAVDERLNVKAYIVPGLGDAGDRTFGVR